MPDDDITYDGAARQARGEVWDRLLEVQSLLKVEKGQVNDFAHFNYRSKEDILEAAKPLCHERGLVILCDDEVLVVGERFYIVTTASVTDVLTRETVSAHGIAREELSKKGMDSAQVTGTASSYAGKRALGNLFALDDTKDSDAQPAQAQAQPPATGPFAMRCRTCGHVHQFADLDNYRQWSEYWAGGGDANRCCPAPDLEVVGQ